MPLSVTSLCMPCEISTSSVRDFVFTRNCLIMQCPPFRFRIAPAPDRIKVGCGPGECGIINRAGRVIPAYFTLCIPNSTLRTRLILLPFDSDIFMSPRPRFFKDRIDGMRHQGIYAGQVPDNVEVYMARLDGFTEPLAKPLEMRLDKLPFRYHEVLFVSYHPAGKIPVLTRKGRYRQIKVLHDLLMEHGDLLQPLLREHDSLVDPLYRERHEVPVYDVADVFEVADDLQQRKRAMGLRFREVRGRQPGQIEPYLPVEHVDQIVLVFNAPYQRRLIALKGLDRVRKHLAHDIGGAQDLTGGLAEGERRGGEHVLVEIHGAELFLFRFFRNQVGDKPGEQRDKRQQKHGHDHVEQGMSVGDLPGQIMVRKPDKAQKGRHKEQGERDPAHLESHMRPGNAPRLGRGAQACHQGGGTSADVRAENDINCGIKRDQAVARQRKRNADGRRAAVDKRRQDRGKKDPRHGRPYQNKKDLFEQVALFERGHGVGHDLDGKEDKTEPEQALSYIRVQVPLGEKRENKTCPHKKNGVIIDMESDKLYRERGADVRAQDHGEGLAKGHEPGAHKAHEHDRGGAARLNDAGDEGPRSHGRQPVARERPQERTDPRAGRVLKPVIEQFYAVEEEEHPAEKRDIYHQLYYA